LVEFVGFIEFVELLEFVGFVVVAGLLRPYEARLSEAGQSGDGGALIELPSPVRTSVQSRREIPSLVQFLGRPFYVFVSYRYCFGGDFPDVRILPTVGPMLSKILREAYPESHLQHLS
jgi:hypothetical protein